MSGKEGLGCPAFAVAPGWEVLGLSQIVARKRRFKRALPRAFLIAANAGTLCQTRRADITGNEPGTKTGRYFVAYAYRVYINMLYNSHIMNYQQIITIEPGKRGGRPCIRRMRIAVSDVLGWLAAGMSHEEIIGDFPELTEDDIRACLAFAADRERRTLTAV